MSKRRVRYTTRQVIARLRELGACREAIAHFRRLSLDQRMGPLRAAGRLLRQARLRLESMKPDDLVLGNLSYSEENRVPGYFRWLLYGLPGAPFHPAHRRQAPGATAPTRPAPDAHGKTVGGP